MEKAAFRKIMWKTFKSKSILFRYLNEKHSFYRRVQGLKRMNDIKSFKITFSEKERWKNVGKHGFTEKCILRLCGCDCAFFIFLLSV